MASDRAVWGTTDGKCGLGPRPRAVSRPHVRPRGRRAIRSSLPCMTRLLLSTRTSPGKPWNGSCRSGRRGPKSSASQSRPRRGSASAIANDGEQALGAGRKRSQGGGVAQHSHARSNIVALLRARPPQARRHRRLRPNSGLCRRDRPLAGGRRHHTTSGPDGRSRGGACESELK